MIVLTEASAHVAPSASARDLQAATDAARLVGCAVYPLPQDFAVCGDDADAALWLVPHQERETPGVWIGYIPSPARYEAVYEAALSRNIRLVNAPHEHLDAQEFPRAYARLGDLTPRSVIIGDASESDAALAALGGPPVFVKGAVQSRKANGWRTCVAENADELRRLVGELLALPNRSRGQIVVRELTVLRHTRVGPGGFPLGREYRAFVLNGRIVGLGYYWEGDDPLAPLTAGERADVEALAREAARRVGAPYIAVDIGQTEDGAWIVIETGDAQFSGVSQVPLLSLWNALNNAG